MQKQNQGPPSGPHTPTGGAAPVSEPSSALSDIQKLRQEMGELVRRQTPGASQQMGPGFPPGGATPRLPGTPIDQQPPRFEVLQI